MLDSFEKRDFNQGWNDGLASKNRGDLHCKWMNGRCNVDNEYLKKGAKHFNPIYARGFELAFMEGVR